MKTYLRHLLTLKLLVAGDAIVYDELVHASTYDGMATCLAQCRKQFRHNDVDSMRDAIAAVMDTQPQIVDGSRSLLISVESVYSMDGDVCPLVEMMEVAREMCPKGNAVFIVDEAHATGILGPKGAGLVSQLGLEKEVAIRLHTCGKALGSTGGKQKRKLTLRLAITTTCVVKEYLLTSVSKAVILGSEPVRNTIINYARSIIYTTAPSFPTVAGIRAAYKLMADGNTKEVMPSITIAAKGLNI